MSSHDIASIRNELNRDEELIWSGRPLQGLHLQAADSLLIPLGLLVASLALLWILMPTEPNIGTFLFLGLPCALMGCYMAFGRVFMAAHTRSKTIYGLTNERIVIISGLLVREITSIDLQTIDEITFDQAPGEAGSILFGPLPNNGGLQRDVSWLSTAQHAPPRFELIPDTKQVYDMIRSAQRSCAVH